MNEPDNITNQLHSNSMIIKSPEIFHIRDSHYMEGLNICNMSQKHLQKMERETMKTSMNNLCLHLSIVLIIQRAICNKCSQTFCSQSFTQRKRQHI